MYIEAFQNYFGAQVIVLFYIVQIQASNLEGLSHWGSAPKSSDQQTRSIAVALQQPTQVTPCCNMFAPLRQLSSNSPGVRMSFFAEAASVPCLTQMSGIWTWDTEFRVPFLGSRVSSRYRRYLVCWTVSVSEELLTGLHQTWGKGHRWTRWTFPALKVVFCFQISVVFIFWHVYHM
jgi:hypothetical protein